VQRVITEGAYLRIGGPTAALSSTGQGSRARLDRAMPRAAKPAGDAAQVDATRRDPLRTEG